MLRWFQLARDSYSSLEDAKPRLTHLFTDVDAWQHTDKVGNICRITQYRLPVRLLFWRGPRGYICATVHRRLRSMRLCTWCRYIGNYRFRWTTHRWKLQWIMTPQQPSTYLLHVATLCYMCTLLTFYLLRIVSMFYCEIVMASLGCCLPSCQKSHFRLIARMSHRWCVFVVSQ